jgi:hypothetical protein
MGQLLVEFRRTDAPSSAAGQCGALTLEFGHFK